MAGKGSFVAQVDQLAEQQKKQAVDAFRAAAQKLRQLGLTQAQLAQLRGTALAPGEVYTGFPPKDS